MELAIMSALLVSFLILHRIERKMAMYFPDLIDEYKQSLKELKAAGGCPGMERDMLEAIKWMETGYDPAEYRAATRTDAYVMDHHLMQDLIIYVDSNADTMEKLNDLEKHSYERWGNTTISLQLEIERMSDIKEVINCAMARLTKNERAVFVMVYAERMSFSKVAKLLGISRGTVQSYLKRAKLKINYNISKFALQMPI